MVLPKVTAIACIQDGKCRGKVAEALKHPTDQVA